MKKHDLAEALRKRQIKKGFHTREKLNKIPDSVIINSYCVCTHCDKLFIDPEHLKRIIMESVSVEDFLNMTMPENKCCWENKLIDIKNGN